MSLAFPLVGLLLLGPALMGCGESGPQNSDTSPPPTVIVAKPKVRIIVDQDEYTGRFVPVDLVEIHARASGYLERVHFADGQLVKQGDLLFTMDKRSFQNTLDQAEANLGSARANLAYAEEELASSAAQLRENKIPKQVYNQRLMAKRTAEATVQASEASVRQATIDLNFTELRAPVNGRIGDRRVSPGNLVTGGTGGNPTLLATIISNDPIRFEFTIGEDALLRYERLAGQYKTSSEGSKSGTGMTPVRLQLLDEPNYTHEGRMDFIDNVVDRSSGTIRARAVFSNPDGLFAPGMSGRIQMPAASPYQALVMPNAAISSEQERKYVLVVDSNNIARQRYILGQDGGEFHIIKHGLATDDRVIVDGLIFVRPGIKVAPQEEGDGESSDPPANAPAAKTD
jgi:membrane fusion protein, multidrug efflux system